MPRASRAVLLLLVMVWQSLTLIVSASVSEPLELYRHVTVHNQELDHHHHDDRSLHIEKTVKSVDHLHADNDIESVGVVSTLIDAKSSSKPILPGLDVPKMHVSTFLEGPLRPPQALS